MFVGAGVHRIKCLCVFMCVCVSGLNACCRVWQAGVSLPAARANRALWLNHFTQRRVLGEPAQDFDSLERPGVTRKWLKTQRELG